MVGNHKINIWVIFRSLWCDNTPSQKLEFKLRYLYFTGNSDLMVGWFYVSVGITQIYVLVFEFLGKSYVGFHKLSVWWQMSLITGFLIWNLRLLKVLLICSPLQTFKFDTIKNNRPLVQIGTLHKSIIPYKE